MTLKVACIGAGPGGLLFSALLKGCVPDAEVTIFERNLPTDAFGFGVVFSDATLRKINEADSVLLDGLREFGRHWDTIEMRAKGERHTFAGNGMSAIHRRTLLRLLQERAVRAGVDIRFSTPVNSLAELDDYDVIVAADGASSRTRQELGGLGHLVQAAASKYIWFGTTYMFPGLTNVHVRTEHGLFGVVGYPISDDLSTFVAETDEDTWKRAGLDRFDTSQPPGSTDEKSQRYLEKHFASHIASHTLVGNNSRWANFQTRRTEKWYSGNVVLLGDAIHTAHFSVGSGTKMAMEDAIVLAQAVARHRDDLPAAFAHYQQERKPAADKIQAAARPSLSWWEHFADYDVSFDPLQFAFHYFTRFLHIGQVRQRDPEFAKAVEAEWLQANAAPPLETPIVVHATRFCGRQLQITADDGVLYLTESSSDARVPIVTSVADDAEGAVAVLVQAPELESDVASAVSTLPTTGVVVVQGGSSLTRSLLTDEARLRRGMTAVVVEECEDERAATLILSGRADAVVSGATIHARGGTRV